MNKECQSWAADLSAYSDEELDETAAIALEAHLDGCAECRGEFARTRKLKSLLNTAVPGRAADRRTGHRLWARFSKAMSGWVAGPDPATKGVPP